MTKPSIPAALAALLFVTMAAHAAEPEGGVDADEARWGLGLGVAVKKSLYAGVGNKSSILPLLAYDSKRIRLFGNQLDVKLPSYGPVSFSLRTQFSIGQGYEASDAAALQGMDKRKGAIYVGAASTWRNEVANLSLSWLKDVSGNSRGSVLRLGVERALRLGPTIEIVPHAGWSSYDRKHVDYYYGVKASEATEARALYQGRATSALQFGVRYQQALAPQQRIFVDVSSTRYGAGITDSPIVVRKSEPAVRLGYSYSF
jgi:outer membrane protein